MISTRVGTAKSGVPMKTSLSGIPPPSDAVLALALFLAGSLGELPDDQVALQLREVVDEEHAVEVIDLMLEADGEEPLGILLLKLPVVVDIAHPDARRTL